MNICFLTRKEKLGVENAIKYLDKIATKIDIFDESKIKEFPKEIFETSYDMIIAYMGWIVPNTVLQNTIKKWNLNFHPLVPLNILVQDVSILLFIMKLKNMVLQ